MNIPQFNLDNLPINADSCDYLRAIIAEEKRVCGPIDARTRVLENEFIKLAYQA